MLAPVRDDTWNVLNIQHTTPNSKDGIIQTPPPPDQVRARYHDRPISRIPQCIRQISHNVSFSDRNADTCAHFCYKMVHCGIRDWCIFGFVQKLRCEACSNTGWPHGMGKLSPLLTHCEGNPRSSVPRKGESKTSFDASLVPATEHL